MITRHNVFAGPDMSDLKQSLFDGKTVTFTVDPGGTQNARVTVVRVVEGTEPEKWVIEGNMLRIGSTLTFRGEYSTHTRKGCIEGDF